MLPGDEDIGRLEFAVNHSFLVGVLDGLADLDEQIQSRACRQVKLIAEVRDPGTPHEFHHEKRPSRFGCAGIEDLRDGIAQVPRQAAEQPVGGVRHLLRPDCPAGRYQVKLSPLWTDPMMDRSTARRIHNVRWLQALVPTF